MHSDTEYLSEAHLFGSPMYADDLADTPSKLQQMLDTVHAYACKWHYKFNASKSAILVFGESLQSRTRNRLCRTWYLGLDIVPESDTVRHLGSSTHCWNILHNKTMERASSARSAFFALNSLGTRFGLLHPSNILCINHAL